MAFGKRQMCVCLASSVVYEVRPIRERLVSRRDSFPGETSSSYGQGETIVSSDGPGERLVCSSSDRPGETSM